MLAKLTSAAVLGIEAYLVRVEVDLASGLPSMSVVGLPESAVREGRERVTAALHNSGLELPSKRITVNLAPADVPKRGSAFDLPIAVGVLAAGGLVPEGALDGVCMVGELGLDGELRPVPGALPFALRCAEEGIGTLVVPWENRREAAVVEGVRVIPARSLVQVLGHLRGDPEIASMAPDPERRAPTRSLALDYADVRGQEHAKRALEVAAAGAHNVLMIGPPGAGKSMLARRLPGILPSLTRAESLELTRIHSVAGRIRPGWGLVAERPFRAPHHTTSEAGLIGGGSIPRPGDVSLAHHGVLFLDELPEFRRTALEALRQPMEDRQVAIGRARVGVTYPSHFMLVAAMNPCPCGFHGDGIGRCTCHDGEVRRYRARISGPLLDRIDVHLEVPALTPREMAARAPGEASATIRERVERCRQRQLERFARVPGLYANAHMGVEEVRRWCRPDLPGERMLQDAVRHLGLSARAYHRVLKLARTIADLEFTAEIEAAHVAEAIQYRSLDRRAAARP